MEQLQTTLKSLHLGGMAALLPIRYQEAKTHEHDYLDFLESLVNDEISRRKDNLLKRRMKIARFPQLKTIDQFDFSFNPQIPKKEIMSLMSTRFVCDAHNVLFLGPPGVGKSHLALVLGLAALQNGYTTYYRSAFDLVTDLADALRTDQRKECIKKLCSYQLLIIDEFGMKKMPPSAADDLLEIIHRRYETASTIIATNRPINDWGMLLGDNAATAAILDRFLDKTTILSIKGKSYRLTHKNTPESN
ncbi:MAG: IS21-like element helper ATPase IstB [Bacillota bacterium]|nr:IS21-like element helper ATPase IstB [Bacillota bacterium]